LTGLLSSLTRNKQKIKSFPSHYGSSGRADLRFHSPQPDTSLRCQTTDTGLVYRVYKSVYLRNPSLMGYYSFNRPRRDGWLSWPCWLTGSGRFTHKVVTRPAVSLAQDRESSPARTGGLTTMLRHQPVITVKNGLLNKKSKVLCSGVLF